jgi:fermentation-respiration switch protein FrsA (DUF1100 family)
LSLENWLIYKPAGPDDWQPNAQMQDISLSTADGVKLHAWWLPKSDARGAVLFLHGNAGNLSSRGSLMSVLRHELGESVLIVDYPGYGKSEGSPSEAGCYAAADAAYDWLTNAQKIPSESLIIFGASLGGGVAVDLASRKPHRALVLAKTFTSMPDVAQTVMPFFPVRWVMRNRFDSLGKLDLCKRPIFIAHGDADTLIPFSQGERLYQAAHEPKQFLRLPGGDHNDPLPDAFFVALKQFLAKSAAAPN